MGGIFRCVHLIGRFENEAYSVDADTLIWLAVGIDLGNQVFFLSKPSSGTDELFLVFFLFIFNGKETNGWYLSLRPSYRTLWKWGLQCGRRHFDLIGRWSRSWKSSVFSFQTIIQDRRTIPSIFLFIFNGKEMNGWYLSLRPS